MSNISTAKLDRTALKTHLTQLGLSFRLRLIRTNRVFIIRVYLLSSEEDPNLPSAWGSTSLEILRVDTIPRKKG